MELTKEQKETAQANDWEVEAVIAYVKLGIGDDNLDNFEEAYQGKWNDDEKFTEELLEEMGEIPENFPLYIHIDWEGTARDVMMDYSEQDGYYFRNL